MRSKYFLLIDDDPEELEILTNALKDTHGDIVMQYAVNGEEALDLLEGDHQKGIVPALIILDLNMPRMNGSQTLEILKSTSSKFHNIPVVIYSTSVNTYEKDRCLLLGAHSYLTKPTSYVEIHNTVQYFLEVAAT